ncbi:MAG: DNRLRE domain-containing protein, partial [Acidobacteria bacterium]|nr:DNRLRE domain-containing protein [Acidobacteriota bacterium]
MRSHSSKVCLSDLLRMLTRYRSALLAIGFLALVTSSVWGQDAVLTDDAQVSTTTPNTPDGAAQVMRVRPGVNRAFLKFSLNPTLLPPGTVGMFVGRATLKVYVNTVNIPGGIQVAPALAGVTPWAEATLTNSNAPALGPVTGLPASVALAQKWVTFDVTRLVQQWIDNPGSNNGLALLSSGADVEIDSKEDIPFIFGGGLLLSGHPAQLEITLNHAATADAATLAANATNLGGAPSTNYVQTNSPLVNGPRTPLPGSSFYIQNATTPQTADFNITGGGTVGGSVLVGPPAVAEGLPGVSDFSTLTVHGTNYGEAKIQADQLGAILSLDSTIGGVRRDYTLENGVRGQAGVFAIFDRTAYSAAPANPFAGIRLQIDPTGLVTIPQSLSVGQTLTTNTLSTNIVNANQQFTLGGSHLISANNNISSTFVGLEAGLNNANGPLPSGWFNTFVGTHAGKSNTI